MHLTLSLLDKYDNTLHTFQELGKATAPVELNRGRHFAVHPAVGAMVSVTAEMKAQSVRADGSIRLRGVVHLYLDDEDDEGDASSSSSS